MSVHVVRVFTSLWVSKDPAAMQFPQEVRDRKHLDIAKPVGPGAAIDADLAFDFDVAACGHVPHGTLPLPLPASRVLHLDAHHPRLVAGLALAGLDDEIDFGAASGLIVGDRAVIAAGGVPYPQFMIDQGFERRGAPSLVNVVTAETRPNNAYVNYIIKD